jgi:hypothetical protein
MKKNITFSAFFVCTFLFSFSQWYNPDKVNKKAAKIYAIAYEEAETGKYNAAIQHINEAYKG